MAGLRALLRGEDNAAGRPALELLFSDWREKPEADVLLEGIERFRCDYLLGTDETRMRASLDWLGGDVEQILGERYDEIRLIP